MTTPTPSQRVDEQERSASSMATYPGRVVKADFARTLAVELECAERDLAAAATILAAIFGPAIIRRSEADWIAHETIERAKRRS